MLLADHQPRDPYESPDMEVSAICPYYHMQTNAVYIEDAGSRPSDIHGGRSRLGISNTPKRKVSITILLQKYHLSRPTLANRDRVVISLTHHDGDDDQDRAGIFTTVMQQHNSLDFHELINLAIMIPRGNGHIDIRDALGEFGARFSSQTVQARAIRAESCLDKAMSYLRKAMNWGSIRCTSPMSLHAAWQQHVVTKRRPKMQDDFEAQLRMADSAVEDIARALLARGVGWNVMRPVSHDLTSVYQPS